MAESEWYYGVGGEQQGPVTLAELRKLVAAGTVGADDLVWCEGMGDWEPSSMVKALASDKPKPARPATELKKVAVPAGPRPAKRAERWADEIQPPADERGVEPKKPKKVRVGPPVSAEQAARLDEIAPPIGPPADDEAGPIVPPEPPEFEEPAAEETAAEEDELSPNDEPVAFHKQRPAGLPRPQRRAESQRTEYVPVPMPEPAPPPSKLAVAIQILGWGTCALAVTGAITWFAIVGLRGEGAGSATSSAAALFAFAAAAWVVAHAIDRMAASFSDLGR